MKIIHAGDLHVWRKEIPALDAFAPKRWLGTLNLLIRRARMFPPELRSKALQAIEAEAPDLVIFSGDFSQASLRSEYRECRELFATLQQQLGDRLFAIPGNHDAYTARSVRQKSLEQELPWVRMEPVSRLDLEGKLTVVSVRHEEPFRFRSNGIVREERQEQLRQVLSQCATEHRTVLLVGHFPYATPPAHPETETHKLIGEELFAEVVREFQPALYLHGHKHVRWALRPDTTPETLCLNCGSLGMQHHSLEKQAGFLSWHQEEDGSIQHLTAHTLDLNGATRKAPLPLP